MRKKLLLLLAGAALALPTAAQSDGMTFDDNDVVTITINNTTGTLHMNGNYGNQWTSNNVYPGLRMGTGANGTGDKNNMNTQGDFINLHSGQGICTYTLAAESDDYYVSSFSFTATLAQNGAPVLTVGSDTQTITAEGHNFSSGTIAEGQAASFTLSYNGSGNNNKPVTVTNFTVTLSPKSDPAIPTASGWYNIQVKEGGNLNSYAGRYVATVNEEYRQSATNFYALKMKEVSDLTEDATTILGIDVDGSNYYVKAENGHYVSYQGLSRLEPENTRIAAGDAANATVKIGGYWNNYSPTGYSENPLIGGGYNATANRWRITKAHPLLRYDIWTVSIIGTTPAAEIKDNTEVTLNNPANKGLASVYNGGTFFVTKGTELSVDDFTADAVAGCGAPIITVDNEAKNITVEYLTLTHVTELFNAAKAAKLSVADRWRGVLGEELYADLTSGLNAITITAEDNSVEAIEAKTAQVEDFVLTDAMILEHVQYRIVTIKSLNRAGHYLAFKSNGTGNVANSLEQPVERAKWLIIKNGNAGQFFLYNLETNCWLGNGLGVTSNTNSRGSFLLVANTSSTGGASLQVMNNAANAGKAIGLNNADANVSWAETGDAAASFELALAGVKSDAIDTTGATCYRIRSNRNAEQARGSLLAVTDNTVLGAERNDNVTTAKDGINALWTVKAAGDGKVKILSVVAQYEEGAEPYGLAGIGNNGKTCAVTAEGSLLSIHQATGKGSYTEKDPSALYIQCPNGNHIDVSNAGERLPIFAQWSGMDATRNNNGSIFYFEVAYDAEEIINDYIASVNTVAKTESDFNAEIALYAGNAALWDEEAVNAALDAEGALTYQETATSIVEANAIGLEANALHTQQEEILGKLIRSANGKIVKIASGRNTSNQTDYTTWFLKPYTDGKTVTMRNASSMDLLWMIESADGNNFHIRNYATGQYIKSSNGNSIWSMTDNADATLGYFTLVPVERTNESKSHAFNIKMHGSSEHVYLHDDGNNYSNNTNTHKALGWKGSDGEGSCWFATVADDEAVAAPVEVMVEYVAGDGDVASKHRVKFTGASTREGVTYAAHHDILISYVPRTQQAQTLKVAAEEGDDSAIRLSLNDAYAENGNLYIDTNDLSLDCDYRLEVPVGVMQISSSKHNMAGTYEFTVNNDGTTTGIDEVIAEPVIVAEGIYDLQGRRLSAPVKGINIINGKKVLVK